VEPVLEDVVSKWQNEIHDVYNLKAPLSNVYSSVSQTKIHHIQEMIRFPNMLTLDILRPRWHVGKEGVLDAAAQMGISSQGQPGETRLFQSQFIELVVVLGLPLNDLGHELLVAGIADGTTQTRHRSF